MQFNSQSKSDLSELDSMEDVHVSHLLPNKQHLHQRFIDTLQKILPHLGKDESKVISALIILALKLEGIIGKDLSEKDTKMIEILKECIISDEDKKDSILKIADRFNTSTSD